MADGHRLQLLFGTGQTAAKRPSRRQRLLLWPPVHQLADALRLVGLRDRLRCPHCAAVGTFKPHGGWLDGRDVRRVRRWLCKWCGHYLGPEGVLRAFPDQERHHWTVPRPYDPAAPAVAQYTPRDTVAAGLGDVWPWAG